MALMFDPMYLINLTLCIIIFVLGFFGYKKTGNMVPLYIGIAFGLFGISHLATILGLKGSFEPVLIIVRTAAYLAVIFSLYTFLKQRK